MIQDLLGTFVPALQNTAVLAANLLATGLCVAAWGYFLYQGVIDPLGGINTLWPLFGISNQMLAGDRADPRTVVLFKMKRERYAWVTIVPTIWLLHLHADRRPPEALPPGSGDRLPRARAQFSGALASGQDPGPGQDDRGDAAHRLQRHVDAALCALFIAVVLAMLVYGFLAIRQALSNPNVSAKEMGYEMQAAQ